MNAASDTERSAGVDGADEFERRTRALLLASVDQLNGTTRSRLTQARFAAVAARTSRLRYQWQRWAPAGAVAMAAIALLVLFVPHGVRTPVSPVANGALEDMDLLSSDLPLNGDSDMDYDFYEWAVAQANGGAAPASQDAAGTPSTGA